MTNQSTTRSSSTLASSYALPPLWTLVVVQLHPAMFDYTPRDIAPLLGITVEQVRGYCHDTWPNWPGQYLLDFEHAAILIYRVCRGARKLPDRDKMFAQLRESGIVGPEFPAGDARLHRAMRAVAQDREERIARRLARK